MAKIDVTVLDKDIKRGNLKSLYAVVGEEMHLADAAINIIKKSVLGEACDEMAIQRFSALNASPGEVEDALKTIPFLSPKLLVIISEFSKSKKALLDTLAAYAKKPVDSSVLLIVGGKVDGRSSLMQTISKEGCVVECKPLYPDKIPFWINMEVKRRGRQMSQEAARFLAEMVGSDLSQVSQAIERLILFIGKRKLIELSDVEQAIAETHQRTIFELTDAVGKRNLSKAISLLHNILENGGVPVLTLNMLARHFRILSKAKEVSGRMSSKGDLAKYLGVHPFYVNNYVVQSKNFSSMELRDSFRKLHKCDRSIKSSRLPKEVILERTIILLVK